MRTRLAAVVAAVVVLLAVVVASVAVTVAVVDDRPRADGWGMDGPGMMAGAPRAGGPGGMYGMGPMGGGMNGHMGHMGGMGGPMGGMGGMHAMSVTDEADYLAGMIPHHEEAIEAAGELARSERPEMRELGRSIVEGQTAQVELMEGWLEEWYDGREADADYQPMMRDLSDLDGDALDRAFLEDMLGHHMMAVMMSQQLLAQGLAEHDEVEDLAVDIRDEQHAEIFTMHRWLQEWFGR